MQALSACLVFGVSFTHAQGARDQKYKEAREKMVEMAVVGAGIRNPHVIASIRDTLRHEFLPPNMRDQAYLDAGLPIGEQQTISSPFIVAFMTESLEPKRTDRVLEIGTGSGYQAAVLSPLVEDVYSIEIVEVLGQRAKKTLERLDYHNVHVRIGDGYKGWPEAAPFDKIIVTCSPESVPEPLVEQLAEGGKMVIPVGERHQQTLYLYRKENGKLVAEPLRPTLFVPMTGTAEEQREVLPDPGKPEILNPSFEEEPDKKGFMAGWFYQRSLTRVQDSSAPNGKYFIRFDSQQPGQKAHLMQGFAIDGEQVSKVVLSASIKCDRVLAGPFPNDLPLVALTFYDELRRELGTALIGPFQGTRDWRNYDHPVDVPKQTREAMVRIGLFGATGSVSFDNVFIRFEKRD